MRRISKGVLEFATPVVEHDQYILGALERGNLFEYISQAKLPPSDKKSLEDSDVKSTYGYGGKTEEEYFKLWEDIEKKGYMKNKFGIYYPVKTYESTIYRDSIIGLRRNDPARRFEYFGEKYIKILDENNIEKLDKLFKRTLEFYGLNSFPEKDLCIGKYYDRVCIYFRDYWVDWFNMVETEYYKEGV